MKINDNSQNQGICQDARFLLGLQVNDTGSYPNQDLIRSVNVWHRRANTKILTASGTWEYDDERWDTLPVATSDLVDEQQDYELPKDCQKVLRVEVKNNSGDLLQLVQIDQSEISEAMAEHYEDAGFPAEYDIVGRSIFLYPKPSSSDVTLSEGLKLYYLREVKDFSLTETSTEPGFAENFHRYLSYGSALDYAQANGMTDKIGRLSNEIRLMEREMEKFYGSRNVAKKLRINPSGGGIIGRY